MEKLQENRDISKFRNIISPIPVYHFNSTELQLFEPRMEQNPSPRIRVLTEKVRGKLPCCEQTRILPTNFWDVKLSQ